MTTFLVFGAGGFQGGAVAKLLADHGHHVRGFSRTAERIPNGVEPFTGDLNNPADLKAAFAGVTHASVTLPLAGSGEINDLAQAAQGVQRLVFNATNRPPSSVTGVAAFDTRREAATILLESGVPTTVLRPPVYLENLCGPWTAGPLMREGVLRYPLPADLPVAWLSHADLAAATAAALTADGLEGEMLDLGGPVAVTGPELAAAFAEVLEREVTYEAQDPQDFENTLAAVFGPQAAADVASTYHWIAGHAPADFYAAADDRLSVTLTPLRSWIAAQPWTVLG